MRRITAPCALGLLVLVASLGESTLQVQAQQATHTLKEQLEVGSVRIVLGQRAMDSTLTYYPGTNYATTTSSSAEKSFQVEEWVTGMDSGRVTEVCRSYRNIDIKDTMEIGGQKISTPGLDWKKNQTFTMKVNADGTRAINHEIMELISADDRAYIQLDTDADLLPGRAVKVGESWKVAKEKLGRIAFATAGDKIDSADVTVKFDSVSANDAGDQVANMTVSGTVKALRKVVNEFDGSTMTDLASDVKFNGNAWFNISRGQMARYEWKGDVTTTGSLNGAAASLSASFTEINAYVYVSVHDRKAENGAEGPEEATELKTFPYGAIDPAHVLIARNNGKLARMQVFDPANRKIVKTLLAMPGQYSINTMALSPDRKRVAFSSSLNAAISIADADVFVLEIESGKVNQVSPGWADNNGIAKPLDTGKSTTVTGRIVWYDDDERNKRDRHDGFSGIARIDHTNCAVAVGADGKFTLTGVPVGTSILLHIYGRLPTYSNGKLRSGLNQYAGLTTVSMVLEESGKDLGDVRINSGYTDTRYDRPSWQGDALWVNLSAWTRSYKVGYPKHTWEMLDFGKQLDLMHGGFSVSPDGKMVAQCRDSSGGTGAVNIYDISGKSVWSGEVPGAIVSYTAEGAWTADGNWACTAGVDSTKGKNLFGAPGLVVAQPAQKAAGMYRAWPQLYGHAMVSLALNETSTVGFMVTHKYDPDKQITYGDAWAWDSTTDSLVRLTSLGDVICVASYGR